MEIQEIEVFIEKDGSVRARVGRAVADPSFLGWEESPGSKGRGAR